MTTTHESVRSVMFLGISLLGLLGYSVALACQRVWFIVSLEGDPSSQSKVFNVLYQVDEIWDR